MNVSNFKKLLTLFKWNAAEKLFPTDSSLPSKIVFDILFQYRNNFIFFDKIVIFAIPRDIKSYRALPKGVHSMWLSRGIAKVIFCNSTLKCIAWVRCVFEGV